MSFKRRVFFRMFPLEKVNFDYLKVDVKSKKIYVRYLQELKSDYPKAEPTYWEFQTDGIFFNSSQQAVYNEVVEGVLENVINGHNGVILAFGQTGSGKTFTTSGLHVTEQELGILPRVARDLIELKRQEPANMKICIQISYVEFYNTYAVDLLCNPPRVIDTYKCRDVRRIIVSNELDALKCIFTGEGRKNFVEQNLTYLSNVCTSVATFHIIRKNMDLTNPTKTCSRLHIIDMAGNESSSNIAQLSKNPKEVGLANVTKTQLEQFILTLIENIPTHVRAKQRTNSLLYYLDGDLSHESILRFIGHIKPKTSDIMITLSMLKFGNILQGLRMKKKVIQLDVNEELESAYLRVKLQAIEKEKHLNSVLLNQDLVSGMNPARLAHLSNLIHEYLTDSIHEVTVMNVADIRTVLRNIKEVCQGYQTDVKKLQMENEVLQTRHGSSISLKQRGSKSSSQSSGGKPSRKASKVRSKDSITREKRASGSIISEKRIKTSGSEEIAPDVTSISQKRKKSTKSTTSAYNKSAQSKRKSSTTSIAARDSKSSIKSGTEIHIQIPDSMPEKQEMWKRFITNSNYKDRLDEYKQNEKDIRNSFMAYIREIKNLKLCRDNLEKCNHDLMLAQTFRKFNSKDEFDDKGNLVLSYAEKDCIEHREDTRDLVLHQQEKTLTSQEMLKVYLENRKNIIKQMEGEFEQFCMDNYKVPSGELECVQDDVASYTFDANLELPDDVLEKPEDIMFIPEISSEAKIIQNLQRLMLHERKKQGELLSKKKNEWKNV